MKLWSSKGKRQANKRLPLLTYLAYLLVATVVFTGVTFSGYISTSTGTDTASVAKFDISATPAAGQGTLLNLDLSVAEAATDVVYTFQVASDSDVKSAYMVTVTLGAELPTGVDITMKLGETPVELTEVSKTVYTYSSELDFVDTHTYTLTFTGNPATVELETQIGVTVSVTAEQVD